ncbi:hypothetical protein MHYP_G00261890 [Metynnis hypsauchen]
MNIFWRLYIKYSQYTCSTVSTSEVGFLATHFLTEEVKAEDNGGLFMSFCVCNVSVQKCYIDKMTRRWCLMDYKPGVQPWLLLLLLSAEAASHSLQYIITATTPGRDFPEYTVVGLVDGEQFVYYDSNIKKMIPKTEWMKKNEDEKYWTTETQKQEAAREIFKANLVILMKRFNQTDGVHTLQRRSGCELHENGSVTGYFQFGYDGEDWLSLDMSTLTWTVAHQKAVSTKLKWEAAGDPNYRKHYLDNDCVDYLRKYVEYGRSTLRRRVSPEVSLFQKDSSSPVVCHATGFFPKAVNISWQKNGEDLHEDVELRETLPNQDGTFQKRSVLTVSPEELNRHNYTCIIQHSSLEEELELQMSERRVLSGDLPPKDKRSAIIIITAVAAVLIICAGLFIWKQKKSAVMICWKKNGEDLHEDVELRETLPNQDGTFQKWSVLTVSPEELNRHNYTCTIQHSSLEKEMVLLVSDLSGASEEASSSNSSTAHHPRVFTLNRESEEAAHRLCGLNH